MEEQEKEAIKYFYNIRATIDESNMLFDEDINIKCGKTMIKNITVILNLIQEQQAELENKDRIINEMANTLEKCMETNVYDFLNICDKCKSNNEDCHGDYCKDTIKQYFERKLNSNE